MYMYRSNWMARHAWEWDGSTSLIAAHLLLW